MMTLDELTQAMHEFVRGKGWYSPDTLKPQTPRNIASSLVIEAAEVLEHFQWSSEPRDVAELSGELADVALYLLQLASVMGIDLEQAILEKLAINAERTWPTADVEGPSVSAGDATAIHARPPDQMDDQSGPEPRGENPCRQRQSNR
jgi:NTP pyrophosphatase (non-canonical NTP hydrolase)